MQTTSPQYLVTAELALPDFAAEERFVLMERQFIARQLQQDAKTPTWQRVAQLGPSRKAWREYDEALHHYGKELQKHRQEVADGLVPIKLAVRNTVADWGIHIKITVENGRILPTKKPPKRPERIDASKPTMWTWLFTSKGFWRSGVHVSSHEMTAKFTRLGDHDGAYVSNDPIYVDYNADTKLKYAITSRRLHQGETGVVLADLGDA